MDLSPKGVNVATMTLQKSVERNEIQRARYPDEPWQYMDAEIALYEHINALKAFAADPVKLYPTILDSDLFTILIQLLTHDNTDIVASVVSVLLEWIDPALLGMEDGLAPHMAALTASLVKNGGQCLVESLARLQPTSPTSSFPTSEMEDDQVGKGTEDVLSLLDNCMEIDLFVQALGEDSIIPGGMSIAALLVRETRLIPWLFEQIGKSMENRALELLTSIAPREDVYLEMPDWSNIQPYKSAIIERDDDVSSSTSINRSSPIDGIELLLQLIAIYRKRQPVDESGVETLENCCVILASALNYSSRNVEAFLRRQGIELVIRCVKEQVHAGGVALKLLDFTGTHSVYRKACEYIIEAGALKVLFPLFMGKKIPQMSSTPITSTKKDKMEWNHEIDKVIIRILYALVRHLRDDSPNDAKQRLLAKFIDHDRCDRLVELCLWYDRKAGIAEYKFYRSDIEESIADEGAVQLAALDARLAGGGDEFHRLAAIIAFCCVGSKRCHEYILVRLQEEGSGISLIRQGLEEFISLLEESEQRKLLQCFLDVI